MYPKYNSRSQQMQDNFFGDSSVRTYACFVCGMNFADFDEYKHHIIQNHEEGREYVLCPLSRCCAPVRCIKTHFKAKHPYDKIPAGVQMQALIWTDVRNPNRKYKKTQFKQGKFKSMKNGGAEFGYRSGWEHDVYECLEIIDEVVAFRGEKLTIGYHYMGEPHQYYPDLIVQFADNHFEMWEVKPKNQITYDKNLAKWTAAEKYCQARGWEFRVITEKEIKSLKKKAGLIRG